MCRRSPLETRRERPQPGLCQHARQLLLRPGRARALHRVRHGDGRRGHHASACDRAQQRGRGGVLPWTSAPINSTAARCTCLNGNMRFLRSGNDKPSHAGRVNWNCCAKAALNAPRPNLLLHHAAHTGTHSAAHAHSRTLTILHHLHHLLHQGRVPFHHAPTRGHLSGLAPSCCRLHSARLSHAGHHVLHDPHALAHERLSFFRGIGPCHAFPDGTQMGDLRVKVCIALLSGRRGRRRCLFVVGWTGGEGNKTRREQ